MHWRITIACFIYYHAYLIKEWERILTEQMSQLENRQIHFGVIGSPKEVERLKELCAHFAITPKIVFQSEERSSFELQTIDRLQHHALQLTEEKNFLYLHTKGVYNDSAFNQFWRRYMGNYLLPELDYLDQFLRCSPYNSAGSLCYWEKRSTHRDLHRYFAGNFWMAKSSYLTSLPKVLDYVEPFLGSESCRYAAESWIGLGELKPLLLDGIEYQDPSEIIRRINWTR